MKSSFRYHNVKQSDVGKGERSVNLLSNYNPALWTNCGSFMNFKYGAKYEITDLLYVVDPSHIFKTAISIIKVFKSQT